MSEDIVRPSHDSQNGLLRSAPGPLEPRLSTTATPEPYVARLEFERPTEEAPPLRHPSRQMMRWGPPPSEYGYDDRDDRRPYGRPSYDYGGHERGIPVPNDYYEEPYQNRPYRRAGSVREPATPARGPPAPPRRPRRRPTYDDPSEDDSEDEKPRRKHRGRRERTPPPEEILRLPFTMWMNSSLKNRKHEWLSARLHALKHSADFVAATGEFVVSIVENKPLLWLGHANGYAHFCGRVPPCSCSLPLLARR